MGYTEEGALNSILTELMQAVFANNYEKVDVLSKAYQRLKSVQTKKEEKQ